MSHQPLRVLHVISGIDPEHGGPTAAIMGLVRAQIHAGLQVSLIATWISPTAFESAALAESFGVKTRLVGPARNPLCRHPDVPVALDETIGQADVVHIHAVWEQIQHEAARAARRLGVPYIVTPHGMLDTWNLRQGWLKKRLYLAARMRRNLAGAGALHVATEMEKSFVQRLRLGRPFIVEPFGLDLPEFDPLPPRGAFRVDHAELRERPIVLFLGRLSAGKGLEVLIPAFARALAAGADVVDPMLVLAGPDYGFEQQARALVRTAGIEARTLFTGMLRGPERINALVDADLIASPSFHENFGIAVAEALAAGRPALVSDQVGLACAIREQGLGAVAAPAAEPFSALLRQWLLQEDLRHAAGARARKYAVEAFDWLRIGRNWQTHYRNLLRV